MEKNDNPYEEYAVWHSRFLRWYGKNKSDPTFLDQLAAFHPHASASKRNTTEKEYIAERMHGYCRKSHDKNRRSPYIRIPRLDDLYALCKAQGVSPNDILLTSDTQETPFRKYCDIYDLLRHTSSGSCIFNRMDISVRDFYRYEDLPDDPRFLKLLKENILLWFDRAFQCTDTGRLPDQADECVFCFKPDESNLDWWIDELLKVLRDKTRNPQLELLRIEPTKGVRFIDSMWVYSFTENEFNELQFRQYERWSHKKHFLASINSFVFVCSVIALKAMSNTSEQRLPRSAIYQYYATCFSNNPSILKFVHNIVLKSFIVINQSTMISANGILCPEDFLRNVDSEEEDSFVERSDAAEQRDISETLRNANSRRY